ncbi:MAG: urea transporter, partial [Gammaproteobacteria bacterium]|nr:urea transporter [Gammaproteobacteria bacterium]
MTSLSSIPKAYATILFIQNPLAGLVILAATLFYPNIGLAGLLGALTGFAITRLWQFPDYAGHIQIFNSLLVGLSLGAFYQLNFYLIG